MIITCVLVAVLSVFPSSTTRLQIWPWAVFAAAGWLLPVCTAIYRLARGLPSARFGGLIDAGFGLLALSALASAFVSPLRGVVTPHLLPFLGACALPYALGPLLDNEHATRTWRISGGLIVTILVISLVLWLQPWTGISPAGPRNDQPFGHANITGSFAVLATTWLLVGAIRETSRKARGLFLFGATLAVITAITSGSRGAVIALAVAGATAAAITLLRRGRRLLFIGFLLLLMCGALAANSSLRSLVLEGRWNPSVRGSNEQRTAMILGGLQLGSERPLLGWGAGSVPHVFPRVRANLPGDADNFLQLHNTPAQLWATLGGLGLVAAALIAAGLAAGLRTRPWTPERIALGSGLVATTAVLLFDHPFATPAFAMLAAAHLVAWAHLPAGTAPPAKKHLVWWIALPLLIPVLVASSRDLAARRAYDDALTQAEANNPDGYVGALRQAIRYAPSDPYYAHALAAFSATGHPFPDVRPAPTTGTASLLEGTLATNPDLEYAHYNLGWLLLGSDPRKAAFHFREAARLAPQRGSVYLGLGLARIRLNDTEGAVRAFATEWLLNPATAWSPIWNRPPLDSLRPSIRALATSAAQTHGTDAWINLQIPAVSAAPYRRTRTGYGVLMGHPEGPTPVDFNIQTRVTLPPALRAQVPTFGWIDGGTLLRFLDAPSP